jgi:hypothetical protein
MGNDIAFSGSPSLHTAAHEATHTLQQSSGVQLEGGVGTPGDVYEQHADDVADAVVRGDDAEPLLDQMPGSGPGVQMQAVQMEGGEDEDDDYDDDEVFSELDGFDEDEDHVREEVAPEEYAGGVMSGANLAMKGAGIMKTALNAEKVKSGTMEGAKTGKDALKGAGSLDSSNWLGAIAKVGKALSFPPVNFLVPVAMLVTTILSTKEQVTNRKAMADNLANEHDKEEDSNPNLIEALGYGLKKTWTKMLKLIWKLTKNALKIVGMLLAMFSGPVGAAILVAVNAFTAAVDIAKIVYEKGRGFWKWLKGTRGKERERSADEIVDAAMAGDESALQTVRVMVSGGTSNKIQNKVGLASEAEATDLSGMDDGELMDWLDDNWGVAVERIKTKLKSV